MPNALADALSPYLRQHADNPVAWQPWGQDAFDEAARRDVPVMVSIGYSTCHWCHVMARESFSDPAIADYMNAHFVAVKVDREEHPEVDSAYLAAASAFTQNLGWPLNVFVNPAGRAFFAGTYWPPEAMTGHPSFRQVLESIADAWEHRRTELEANADDVAAAIVVQAKRASGPLVSREAMEVAVDALVAYEDTEFGGFGPAPKFPVVPVLQWLLEHGSAESVGLADRTLTAMANSALRDPVEGGFFRYATRRDWTEPHYERMLYDNAQLLTAYALLALKVPERADLARDTSAGIGGFLVNVLRLPGGGFASAQNSESIVDGYLTEGDYYALDAAARARQVPPALDEKVLTGWNGLAISGLAFAGFHLGRADWVDAARASAESILSSQMKASGELLRVTLDGKPSAARATLEDYGMLAQGLLHLAQATGEVRWAVEARRLVEKCLVDGEFVVPGGGDPVLVAQGLALASDPTEGAYPSGQSALAAAADQLYLLTSEHRFRAAGERAMEQVAPLAVKQQLGFGAALAVMGGLSMPPTQLVIVSDDPGSPFADHARGFFKQGSVVALVTDNQVAEWVAEGFELFEGRATIGGEATAYLCTDFVCRLPTTDLESLVGLE